jgi:thiamine biosynthesis lipoprotein
VIPTAPARRADRDLAVTSFAAIGTTAAVVSAPTVHQDAVGVVREEIRLVDEACSRFRDDSELAAANSSAGAPVPVSPLFVEYLDAALRGAVLTGGLVDPTVGAALRLLGYDRDFAEIAAGSVQAGGARDASGGSVYLQAVRVPGWQTVSVDRRAMTVSVPPGVELDFGATAKAHCADRAAAHAASLTGEGVLVGLGGDVAVAGEPPPAGWPVGVADDHAAPVGSVHCTVAIRSGGLATSSTAVRRWSRAGAELHHIVDPRRGRPAGVVWRTVSVAASTCLDANIASTAAVVLGHAAPEWLESRGLPSRLVSAGGRVLTLAGWR